MPEDEWIAFQIDYIIKNMGYEYLSCVEKNSYFKKIVEQCIGYDEIKKYFYSEGITCFDSNAKMRTFYVFTSIAGNNRLVYTHNDEEKIRYITQDEINKIYNSGIRILSEKRKEEYESILTNDLKSQNKENNYFEGIHEIALLPEVMDMMGDISDIFQEFQEFQNFRKIGCGWVHD